MKQKNKMLSTHGIKTLFETRLTQLTSLASESQDETAFKNKLNDYLLSGPIYNPAAARQIKRLIDNDGKPFTKPLQNRRLNRNHLTALEVFNESYHQ